MTSGELRKHEIWWMGISKRNPMLRKIEVSCHLCGVLYGLHHPQIAALKDGKDEKEPVDEITIIGSFSSARYRRILAERFYVGDEIRQLIAEG